MSASRASLLFAAALISAPVLVAVSSALDARAEAQCVQNGTTVTCTGSVGSVSYNAPSVTILNVNSLTAIATWVSLTGTGSAAGSGGDSHFTCTPNPSDCAITIGVNTADTCSVNNNAPSGTKCVSTGAAAFGPTGTSGPSVTVTVQAGNLFSHPWIRDGHRRRPIPEARTAAMAVTPTSPETPATAAAAPTAATSR